MTSTNSQEDRWTRLFWGFVGATAVVSTPLARSIDLWISSPAPVLVVQYAAALMLMISWVGALHLAYREPEPHVWNVFFKSVGIPGTIVAVGNAFQL